jgi:predicted MPP superfamily phosphohydrolase
MGRKYVSGRYEIGQMTLFVSNGIGMYRPPVRFNCPPEILLVRLIA